MIETPTKSKRNKKSKSAATHGVGGNGGIQAENQPQTSRKGSRRSEVEAIRARQQQPC